MLCCHMPLCACVCGADGSNLAFVAREPNAHSDYIASVAFSPDGTKIVSSDQSIKLWGVLPCTHKNRTCCVVLCLDGVVTRVLLCGCLRGADGASLARVAEITNAHSNYINSVAFLPGGTKIVSGSSDQNIKLWGVFAWPTHTLHLLSAGVAGW